jgi:hypothetical protein
MEQQVRATVVGRISAWVSFIQKLGPYVLLEIFLPGGTLLALLLFLYQRKQLAEGAADMPIVAWAVGAMRGVYRRVLLWLKAPDASPRPSCRDERHTRSRMSTACRTSG